MIARIYRPSRTAMQSGKAKTRDWILEFEPQRPLSVEPLMGYTSSDDTRRQVRLRFGSADAAIAHAQREGIAYRVERQPGRAQAHKAYADNFRYNRRVPWTH